jgi:hypothetical protein
MCCTVIPWHGKGHQWPMFYGFGDESTIIKQSKCQGCGTKCKQKIYVNIKNISIYAGTNILAKLSRQKKTLPSVSPFGSRKHTDRSAPVSRARYVLDSHHTSVNFPVLVQRLEMYVMHLSAP